VSNRGRQFSSLAWLDLATTEISYLRDDAWDIQILALSNDGTHMALVLNEDGYGKLELFDVAQGWDERRAPSGRSAFFFNDPMFSSTASSIMDSDFYMISYFRK
jgi:hypothetical protein